MKNDDKKFYVLFKENEKMVWKYTISMSDKG